MLKKFGYKYSSYGVSLRKRLLRRWCKLSNLNMKFESQELTANYEHTLFVLLKFFIK